MSMMKLSNLNDLRVNENKLSGTIPPEIGNLKKLQVLYMGMNSFTGSVPDMFNGLKSLCKLCQSFEIFIWKRFTQLKVVYFANSFISRRSATSQQHTPRHTSHDDTVLDRFNKTNDRYQWIKWVTAA